MSVAPGCGSSLSRACGGRGLPCRSHVATDATVTPMEDQLGDAPVRTMMAQAVGLGVAVVDGVRHAMLRLPDDQTGGTLDVILDKAALGQLIAHADDVRRGIIKEPV